MAFRLAAIVHTGEFGRCTDLTDGRIELEASAEACRQRIGRLHILRAGLFPNKPTAKGAWMKTISFVSFEG